MSAIDDTKITQIYIFVISLTSVITVLCRLFLRMWFVTGKVTIEKFIITQHSVASPFFSSVKSVLLIRQKIGLKYSYTNFPCMKEFSIHLNLALLSMQVSRNGSFPPRKQMAPQWHKWKWRRKKNDKETKQILAENWWFSNRQEPLVNRKMPELAVWCLAPNLCCIATPELRPQNSGLQMLAHASYASSATSHTPFISHPSFPRAASGTPRDPRASAHAQRELQAAVDLGEDIKAKTPSL